MPSRTSGRRRHFYAHAAALQIFWFESSPYLCILRLLRPPSLTSPLYLAKTWNTTHQITPESAQADQGNLHTKRLIHHPSLRLHFFARLANHPQNVDLVAHAKHPHRLVQHVHAEKNVLSPFLLPRGNVRSGPGQIERRGGGTAVERLRRGTRENKRECILDFHTEGALLK